MGKILRRKEMLKQTGLSSSTQWRLERLGRFPARRAISDALVGWLADEVEAWITERRTVTADNMKAAVPESRQGGSQKPCKKGGAAK